MDDSCPSKPRHRRCPFTLRALFGLMTAIALFLAWFGHQYRQGQKAKIAIEELGGAAFIRNHWDHRWGRAISADFSQTDIGDKELARIAEMPTLQSLVLEGTAITDRGLAHIQRMRNIESLFISDTDVSVEGLEQLEHASKLTFLQAHRTQITDSGVADLKLALPELEIYYTAP